MSESFKVGQKVEVIGKDVKGTIAFYGATQFASGKWIGLILDEPKGKNNGTVQNHVYFQCEENYGMFVRSTQVAFLDHEGKQIKQREKSEQAPSKLPGRMSTSRMSLASSRQSLSGSRQSLTGSRQSLSGSRSQLASPSVDKPTENENSSQTSKRASFVENFVETLRPQFTPGHSMSTSMISTEDKISNLQFQQELENRNQQIKDLSEKLETLKLKRQEDKEALKDFDKMKIQLEQLIEFKAKIMESQASLQRELQKAKQEAKDAIEARNVHAEEMADLTDAAEMATVEKEMAEEKAETLQIELDALREKLEEVTLDLEIIKTEFQNRASGTGDATSTYELKQLEQQNTRLRETLVKMRDLSAHDKHEYQKLMKEMDQKKSEIAELGRTKEKLSSRVEELEQQISDLQEQVDAALGAEEMVVILGEQNLTLEEKVTRFQEEVRELEALQDMNDQLVESNAELEMDLREELDMAHAATREALRERDAVLETLNDREMTINKFRELVHKLQEQSLDLQARLEKETSRPVSALPDIFDFNKMFIETKAYTKAIDLELRRVEAQQLQQHIKYLTAYMPDTFMNRGGDHDAVLVLLLVPRLICKSDILLGQIKDKYRAVEKIDRNATVKGHAVEQYVFGCRFSYCLHALQAILRQFMHGLSTCKPETLLKVGATYPELVGQERIIDGFVELIKRDQLDENIPTDALEKCINYFYTMYPVLFVADGAPNHTQLLGDNLKVLSSACDALSVDATVVRCLIESANVSDMGLLAQHVITSAESMQQQLKLIKRRIPSDANVANLGLSKEVPETLYHCFNHVGKVMKLLQDVIKNCVLAINSSGEPEKGLSPEKVKDLAINASDKIYEQDDLGPVQSVKNSLSFALTQITQLAQFLQDNEYEIATANKNEEKPTPPVSLRAQAVKKELEQTKTLTSKLENKDSDIKELRKVVKEKQEQLSEMTIRKELAEKKLGNVNKDYELTLEKLQRKYEEAQNNLKKKEKEFEDTLDHLQTDIDSLENEKTLLKEKLSLYRRQTVDPASIVSGQPSLGPILPAVVRDSPMLLQQIEYYKNLYNREKDERIELESEKLMGVLKGLCPLPSYDRKEDKDLDNLIAEGKALEMEMLTYMATYTFPPCQRASDPTRAWMKHLAEERDKELSLQAKTERYRMKVEEEVMKRKGGYVESDFKTFPTNEMAKAIKESKAVNVGYVKIPKKLLSKNEEPAFIDTDVNLKHLKNLIENFASIKIN